MRRTTIALLTAMVLAICAGCSDRDNNPGDEESRAESQAECGHESPLQVSDSGFSEVTDTSDENLKAVSFGALLENPSDSESVADSAAVVVSFLDESGEDIPADRNDSDVDATQSFDLAAMAPGSQRAVSGQALLAEVPAEIAVTSTGACLKDDESATDDVTATAATLDRDDTELHAELALNSTFDKEVWGYPVFIFHNTDNEIVGGGPFRGVSGNPEAILIAAGESEHTTTVDVDGFLPADADLETTDVYIKLSFD